MLTVYNNPITQSKNIELLLKTDKIKKMKKRRKEKGE